MPEALKIVVVGYGSIGARHLRNLTQLDRSGELARPIGEIVVAEPDPDKRNQAGLDFGVTTTESLERALAQRPDVAFICTPSHLHIPLAQAAADAGCQLFIEKPLSIGLEGVDQLAATLARFGTKCLVACNMWFHPAVQEMHRLVSAGELGRPCLFRSYWGHHVAQWHPGADLSQHYSLDPLRGGGTLFDVGAHEFFYVPKLLGNIEFGQTVKGPSGFLETEVDDYALTSVRLEGGAAGTFCFNFLDRCRRRNLEIVGQQGTALWTSEGKAPFRERLRLLTGNGPWTEIALEPSADQMYRWMIVHFFRYLAGQEEAVQSLAEAIKVLQIILALKDGGTYQA